MDSKEFQSFAKDIVDFIVQYVDKVEKYPVFPDVQPGFLDETLEGEFSKYNIFKIRTTILIHFLVF